MFPADFISGSRDFTQNLTSVSLFWFIQLTRASWFRLRACVQRKTLSSLLVLHCASLLRKIFASLARANKRARVQNARDFPQTKLDSVINARFLLNEHGDPHFLFYKFNVNNILNNWEKNWEKSIATFLANEINATDRDVTGPTEQVQIMFPLKDKNINW